MSPDDSAERLLLEWMDASDKGDPTSFEELCARHPHLAPRLRALRDGHERMRGILAGLASPPTDSGPSTDASAPKSFAHPRYELRGEIARGGMGSVLEIYDQSLRRLLAMKVLREDRAGSSPGASERARRESRLLAEAQILAQLDHPGVVAIHEMGLDERGRGYFTMKRVRGQDLGHVIRACRAGDESWTLPRAVAVLVKVCETVAFAHSKGVIHRDLKPSNVLVGRFGEVFVMDWGLAKVLGRAEAPPVPIQHAVLLGRAAPAAAGAAEPPSSIESASLESASVEPASVEPASLSIVRTDRESESGSGESGSSPLLTLEGDVVGTPAYMPPEQARGELDALDARADVYALGAILYHLLAGRPPYAESADGDAHQVLGDVIARAPEPLARAAPGAPEELVAVAEKAMARQSALRYATMLELAEDLRAWSEGRVVRAHRTGAWIELQKWVRRNRGAAAAIAAVVVGVGATAVVQSILKRDVETAQRETAARAEELRREDYLNRISLAAAAFRQGEIHRARERLAGCPVDLRGWEWRHLVRELDTSDLAFRVPSSFTRARFAPGACSILTFTPQSELPVDPAIRLWDASTGRLEAEIRSTDDDDVAVSPDGRYLAAYKRETDVEILDLARGVPVSTLTVEPHEWGNVRFSPDSRRLAVTGNGATEIWDVDRRERVRVLDAGQGHTVACWSPDGATIFVGGQDGTLSVWNVEAGRLEAHFLAHGARIYQVEASPDGRWLATGGWEKNLRVWDVRTWSLAHDTGRLGFATGCVRWSPDSSWLAVVDGPIVRALDAGTWQDRGLLVGHEADVDEVSLDPDGRRAVTGGSDGTVRIWDLEREDRWSHTGGRDFFGGAPRFSADGRWLLVPWNPSGIVELWQVEGRRRVREHRFPGDVGLPAISRDGSKIAVGFDQRVQILAAQSGEVLAEIRGVSQKKGTEQPESLAFDASGDRVSVLDADGTLSLFDARSGQRLWRSEVETRENGWPGRATGGSWSPDGSMIATLGRHRRVQLWDAATGALVRESAPNDALLWSLAFAPDGESLYLGSMRPGRIERWDARTFTRLWSGAQTSLFQIFAPSADGKRLFAFGASQMLDVIDAATGRVIVSLDTDGYRESKLAASPCGDVVVTMSNRGLRFWETRPWK